MSDSDQELDYQEPVAWTLTPYERRVISGVRLYSVIAPEDLYYNSVVEINTILEHRELDKALRHLPPVLVDIILEYHGFHEPHMTDSQHKFFIKDEIYTLFSKALDPRTPLWVRAYITRNYSEYYPLSKVSLIKKVFLVDSQCACLLPEVLREICNQGPDRIRIRSFCKVTRNVARRYFHHDFMKIYVRYLTKILENK